MLPPEAAVFESTRPSGSGDVEQNSTGHTFSGFALNMLYNMPCEHGRRESQAGGAARVGHTPDHVHSAPPLSLSPDRPHTGKLPQETYRGHQKRDHQRAVLPGAFS